MGDECSGWGRLILCNNSVFISVISYNSNLSPIKMDPKKMLSKELAAKVRGHISEQTVSEMVDHFFMHRNTFLLLELMNLRKEVESLREELHKRKKKKSSPSTTGSMKHCNLLHPHFSIKPTKKTFYNQSWISLILFPFPLS